MPVSISRRGKKHGAGVARLTCLPAVSRGTLFSDPVCRSPKQSEGKKRHFLHCCPGSPAGAGETWPRHRGHRSEDGDRADLTRWRGGEHQWALRGGREMRGPGDGRRRGWGGGTSARPSRGGCPRPPHARPMRGSCQVALRSQTLRCLSPPRALHFPSPAVAVHAPPSPSAYALLVHKLEWTSVLCRVQPGSPCVTLGTSVGSVTTTNRRLAPSSFSKLLVYLASNFPVFLCLNTREHLWFTCFGVVLIRIF